MNVSSKNLTPAVLTAVAVAIAIIGAFIGSGAIVGKPVTEVADGWLSADATPIAPAGTAFSIWSVIYLGLAAYAVWQLLPRTRNSVRHQQLRPWAAASALFNALWLGATQLDLLALSVLIILALVAVLIRILLILMAHAPENRLDQVITDGTFGLYLGWVCVATAANITSWLSSIGGDGFGGWRWAATALIVVVGLIGIALTVYDGGRIAPALALGWGVAWIGVARSEGQFESALLVWAAALTAAALLLAPVLVRALTSGSSQYRA